MVHVLLCKIETVALGTMNRFTVESTYLALGKKRQLLLRFPCGTSSFNLIIPLIPFSRSTIQLISSH